MKTKLDIFNQAYIAIVDKGHTPYVLVLVRDKNTVVPMAYVREGRIVLNVSMTATKNLAVTDSLLSFSGTFGGKHQSISVPMENVMAIYSKEDGEGVLFEDDKDRTVVATIPAGVRAEKEPEKKEEKPRPGLRLVK